jgi:hypothetical protein
VKVIGKHRELLVELLIYDLNKDNNNHINFANFIDAETAVGEYWITAYIDNYEERVLPYKSHANKMAGY